MIQAARPIQRESRGFYVMTAVECPPDMEDDRRTEVISLLSDGRTFLNDAGLDRRVLLAEISGRMSTRNEPIVWVRAEAGVSYGTVMSLLSDLANDTPNLHVTVITDKQGAGPVDPDKWLKAWKSGQRFKFPYCSRGQDWNSTIRGQF